MRGRKLKEFTVDQFTAEAENYDSYHKMASMDHPDIVAELEVEPFEDVLDCGCGTGSLLRLLAGHFPGKRFTGIDITPKMIEVAKSQSPDSVEFIVGDCENLPFKDESFDVVICSHSFHHYPSPMDFFKSVSRVLRPGGRLIIRDKTGSWWFLLYCNRFKIIRNRLRHRFGDVRFYSLNQVRRFCLKAGLSVEKLEERAFHKMHCVARKI